MCEKPPRDHKSAVHVFAWTAISCGVSAFETEFHFIFCKPCCLYVLFLHVECHGPYLISVSAVAFVILHRLWPPICFSLLTLLWTEAQTVASSNATMNTSIHFVMTTTLHEIFVQYKILPLTKRAGLSNSLSQTVITLAHYSHCSNSFIAIQSPRKLSMAATENVEEFQLGDVE